MARVEDTFELQNNAYTPNPIQSHRNSPEHTYENPIIPKNNSKNKFLIIGKFMITNVSPLS